MDEAIQKIFEFLDFAFKLETGTWGGNANLLSFLFVSLTIFTFKPFSFLASIVKTIVARLVGDPEPARFLSEPTSPVTEALVLFGFFLLSMLTIWATQGFPSPS